MDRPTREEQYRTPMPEFPTRQDLLLDPTLQMRLEKTARTAAGIAMCKTLESQGIGPRMHDGTFVGTSL